MLKTRAASESLHNAVYSPIIASLMRCKWAKKYPTQAVIITRNDLQVRIKKPFELNLPTGPSGRPNPEKTNG